MRVGIGVGVGVGISSPTVTSVSGERDSALLSATLLTKKVYFPVGRLFNVSEYGAVVSVPTSVVPLKNSTRTIVRFVGAGNASKVILAGAGNVVPSTGFVSSGRLIGSGAGLNGLTVTLIGADVTIWLRLSKARAVTT